VINYVIDLFIYCYMFMERTIHKLEKLVSIQIVMYEGCSKSFANAWPP